MTEFEKACKSLIQQWENGQYSTEMVALTLQELVQYFLKESG